MIDITNPQSPQIVGSVDTPDDAHSVAVSGGYAHVADEFSGLQVIAITNPQSPQIVGSVDTPGRVKGVVVSGSYAYVADGDSGLQILPTQCEPASAPPGHDFGSTLRLRVFPNPGVHQTSIRFDLSVPERVRVSIHDAAGRRVRILHDAILGPGTQDLSWDSRDDRRRQVSAGIYLVRVSADTWATTLRQVIVR